MRALLALFERSLREDTRARLPPILRATLVLVILLIIWTNERDFTRRSAPGREFLAMALFANLGLIAIATLGIFSSAITEEKEDQTLTLLRMTKLSPLAILFGKSTSRLFAALLLLAVQIPFTLLAVTLGGVSMEQVLSSYAVLGATTFFLCNLALLCSVMCRTTIRAGWWTGGITGFLFFLLPMICAATALTRMRPGAFSPDTAWEYFSTWVIEANPAYALAMLLFGRGMVAPIATHALLNLGAGLLCFLLSWLLFDKFCETAGEIVAPARRKGFSIFKRRPGGTRPSIAHPLAWKDYHLLVGGRRMLFIRFAFCGLLFLGTCAFERFVEHAYSPSTPRLWREIGEVTMALAAGVFAIEIGLTASRIFGDERRGLTLGGLLALPRSTGWLIRQKLLGCIPVILPSLVLFGVGLCVVPSWRRGLYFLLERARSEEWIVLSYGIAQALLLPVLVAYLSLRIRRGALPAGIAIVTALNWFTVVLADDLLRQWNEECLAMMAVVSAAAVVVLSVMICREIPQAAARE